MHCGVALANVVRDVHREEWEALLDAAYSSAADRVEPMTMIRKYEQK